MHMPDADYKTIATANNGEAKTNGSDIRDFYKLLRIATAFVKEACRQYPTWGDDTMRLDHAIKAILVCFDCNMDHVWPYLKVLEDARRGVASGD